MWYATYHFVNWSNMMTKIRSVWSQYGTVSTDEHPVCQTNVLQCLPMLPALPSAQTQQISSILGLRNLPPFYFFLITLSKINLFLPYDAMRKLGLCCHPASVCPSVTLVDCIHTAEDIIKLLVQSGSPINLSFWPTTAQYPIPTGTPSVALHKRGWKIFAIFYWNRCLSRLLWNVNRKS